MKKYKGFIPIEGIIVLVVIAAIASAGVWGWMRITTLEANLETEKATVATKEARITVLEKDLRDATAINAKMASSITAQNSQITALIAESDKRGKQAAAAVARASAEAAKWQSMYAETLTRVAPSGDKCESLKMRLDGYIEKRQRESVQ